MSIARPVVRGLSCCVAAAMLIALLALLVTPTAEARSAKTKSEARLATKVCAAAKPPTSTKALRRRCTVLTRRVAKQRARARRAAQTPRPRNTAPKRVGNGSTVTSPSTPPAPAAPAPGPTGRMYSPTSPFNVPIGAAPRIAPNSEAMVSKSLLPYVRSANFANSDEWGIAIVDARPTDPLRSVGTFHWGYGADIVQPGVRIPDGAAPTTGSDHHLAVMDGDRELDMWVADQQTDGSWMAGARTVTSNSGSGVSAEIGGNAAGFALAAGLIRPEEIAQGRIDHALQFTSPYIRNRFVAPAIHGDGREADADAMPMGTRIQLDPAADVSGLPRVQRILAQALKDYGAYLSDSSGSLAIRGEASIGRASQGGPADIWAPVGVTDPSMKDIPWERMRVVTS
jgi:hypothetical protein